MSLKPNLIDYVQLLDGNVAKAPLFVIDFWLESDGYDVTNAIFFVGQNIYLARYRDLDRAFLETDEFNRDPKQFEKLKAFRKNDPFYNEKYADKNFGWFEVPDSEITLFREFDEYKDHVFSKVNNNE